MSVKVTIELPEHVARRVEARAAEEGTPVARLLEAHLRRYAEDWQPRGDPDPRELERLLEERQSELAQIEAEFRIVPR